MSLLERYREWSRRREEERQAKWEKIRRKGKKRFIARTVIFWSFYMTAIFTIPDLMFGKAVTLEQLEVRLLLSVLCGVFVGFANWNSAEDEYRQRHPVAEEIKVEDYDITGRTI